MRKGRNGKRGRIGRIRMSRMSPSQDAPEINIEQSPKGRRTVFEDRMLHEELDGYQAYAQRVRYRLLPGIW